MSANELAATARALVAEGKGILAADESTGTITRRLDTIKVASTPENRRAYRELLFTAPEVESYISGVILYDETIRQQSSEGAPFPALLAGRGIMPGIKVDTGTSDLAGFAGEKITEGLDGLGKRLDEYREIGARFAKWRAVITIGPGCPTTYCIAANAHALARYAALSQQAGLVPIVEPEVLMDGDHAIERCAEVTHSTLQRVFKELHEHRVQLEGMLLKPNMVLPGKDCPQQAGVEEVAAATLACFRHTVPAAVPGIVFLSGGQSAVQATEHLNAMNQSGGQPWELSFSYGRALQGPVLEAWQGQAANVPAAQEFFRQRAKCNGAARFGRYAGHMERAA
ncbi:MAG: fructose-bisphosphate aldolase class I [Candidatus Tectomicrobia bacterium]|nr:fructose-bisphosphate aldolase class I [Candidatus Tectomicrobia bacterium]